MPRTPNGIVADGPTIKLNHIVILTYPGAYSEDVMKLLETLCLLNTRALAFRGNKILYVPQVYSLSDHAINTVETSASTRQTQRTGINMLARTTDTLIITDGRPDAVVQLPQTTIDWLRTTCPRARQVLALGAGVFWLAATGLLDRRRVTTNSALESALVSRYPTLQVEPRQGLQVDGHFYTASERIKSSDILMLLLADRKSPSETRDGLGREASTPLLHKALERPNSVAARICAWWLAHIEDDLNMERSALALNMSERNFRRHFKLDTGYPPHLFLLLLRLELARQALLDSDLPVDKIARRGGLLDGQQLARVFRKYLGASPLEYRRRTPLGWAPKCHQDYARLFDAKQTPQWLIGLHSSSMRHPSTSR